MTIKSIFYYFVLLLFITLTPFNIHYLFNLGSNVILFVEKKILLLQNIYLLIGIVISLVFIRYTKILQTIYIFFHELSHTIAAIFFSARVFEFKVKSDSGYIKSNKTNIIIRLCPYLLPLFPFLLLGVYYATLIYQRHYNQMTAFNPLFFILTGMFYFSTTFYNIQLIIKETTDIDKNQIMLSFLMIINFYLLTSGVLFYLLFFSSDIVNRFYYL